MIAYVDTSTLLELIVDENGSDRAVTIRKSADAVASVALILVEARAALASTMRGRRLTAKQHTDAEGELETLVVDLHIVKPKEELTAIAADLAGSEALRGYDAMHLAAAERRRLHVANPLATS